MVAMAKAGGEEMKSSFDYWSMGQMFMRELTLFTVSDKNLHDDAPDACAMLVDFLVGGIKTVTVARRPF